MYPKWLNDIGSPQFGHEMTGVGCNAHRIISIENRIVEFVADDAVRFDVQPRGNAVMIGKGFRRILGQNVRRTRSYVKQTLEQTLEGIQILFVGLFWYHSLSIYAT